MRYQRLASSLKDAKEFQEELQFLKDLIVTKCNTDISSAITELKNRVSTLPKGFIYNFVHLPKLQLFYLFRVDSSPDNKTL